MGCSENKPSSTFFSKSESRYEKIWNPKTNQLILSDDETYPSRNSQGGWHSAFVLDFNSLKYNTVVFYKDTQLQIAK